MHRGVKSGQKYPEEVRHFCISLAAHSPRAYELVRKAFHNHLPTLKTIKSWFANSDVRSDPGIQDGTVARLKKIADDYEKENKRKLMCSLVFDEIFIRQQVDFSLNEMEYTGFTDYEENAEQLDEEGEGIENTRNIVAKQAIVFLLNGIDCSFEFPIAYYFISELNAVQRKDLLLKIIATVTECGIKITNCTFDGQSSNIPAFHKLGAFLKWNINGKNGRFKPFFTNPINKEKIYVIMDPSHMEKLVRNQWATCEVFYDEHDGEIKWEYIESLYKYSIENDFHTHKLTKKHINWNRHAMNVRIAVETLSDSTANSIEFLMDKNIPEFQGARPTIDFIRRMNKLFDCFNSRHNMDKNIFKRTLSKENKRLVFSFFAQTIKFFSSLRANIKSYKKRTNESGKKKGKKVVDKVVIKPVLQSRIKTGFNGFIIDMISLKLMYNEYVKENNFFTHIATYNLLQDVLEMFFGRIRSCGGFNNNPNMCQFKGAFRKILCNMRLDLSSKTNCRMFDVNLPENVFYSNIYFVSSKRPKLTLNQQTYENQLEPILELVEDEQEWNPEHGWVRARASSVSNTDETVAHPEESVELAEPVEPVAPILNALLDTSDFMILYHATSIEQNLIKIISRKGFFYCNVVGSSCRTVFDENEKFSSIDTQFLSYVPCKSTMEICKRSEQFFKLYDGEKSKPRFDFKTLYCLIFRTMDLDRLYPESKFECEPTHKYQFLKCIVSQYISKRALQIAKQTTLERQGALIREQCTRLVNFKGQ